MTLNILAVSASPSAQSSSALLAELMLSQLPAGCDSSHLRLSTLDAKALLHADTAHPDIRGGIASVADADALILVTPIYKAAYSGVMKCFLDLLDQFALAGKAVLPLATGGSLAHALAVDYALRPVLQSMAARHVVQGLVLLPDQYSKDTYGKIVLAPRAQSMFAAALDHLVHTTSTDPAHRLHGHPDPARVVGL